MPPKAKKALDSLSVEKVKWIELRLTEKAPYNFDTFVALDAVWRYLHSRAPQSTLSPIKHHERMKKIQSQLITYKESN